MNGALIVGITNYPADFQLHACAKDVINLEPLLKKHENGEENFEVDTHTTIKDRGHLRALIIKLFKKPLDTALFYFSGHGMITERGGFMVTPDYKTYDEGVGMDELLNIANQSKIANKIIILDSCHAGVAGKPLNLGGITAMMGEGLTILAASSDDEFALGGCDGSLFTGLLAEALKGGAADVTGNITAANIYAYIDRSLNYVEQRPQFKTNVNQFTVLRKVKPKVPKDILHQLGAYFETPDYNFPLDPSYEFTNYPGKIPQLVEPHALPANEIKFQNLQAMAREGLVIPVDAPHMYFAAMNWKACKLTPLGQHYWNLVKKERV